MVLSVFSFASADHSAPRVIDDGAGDDVGRRRQERHDPDNENASIPEEGEEALHRSVVTFSSLLRTKPLTDNLRSSQKAVSDRWRVSDERTRTSGEPAAHELSSYA